MPIIIIEQDRLRILNHIYDASDCEITVLQHYLLIYNNHILSEIHQCWDQLFRDIRSQVERKWDTSGILRLSDITKNWKIKFHWGSRGAFLDSGESLWSKSNNYTLCVVKFAIRSWSRSQRWLPNNQHRRRRLVE